MKQRQINRIVVTERDLREQVRDLCKLFGWKMYFSWTSIHSPRGFPDLVLANPEQKRVIFAELKSDKGKLTTYQEEWITALDACGQEVYVWRPGDIEGIAAALNTNKAVKAQEFCCYHVTTKDRLPSILENGLLPDSDPSWFSRKTPYIMLSLFPYWSLYKNRKAWGLPEVSGDSVVLIEIEHPDIKREYFDDPEGLRWNKVISPSYISAIVEFKVIKHGKGTAGALID